uniref:Uncharacterized protein n=1 Tax=Branchiostoma floridae TaxID=7739 RepID=C3Z551_BRAFL|eukprot:XP_002596396.1 hypothetical protein BRAFLDRAFT_76213 [Branchiostoma floridae]
MPKEGREKKYRVDRTQGVAMSAKIGQNDALHREERESRREQFGFLLPPGTTLPLPQRVEEETRALSARPHDKAVVSKHKGAQNRKDRRKRPYESSWRAGDGEFTDDERSPSRGRQGQDRHGSAQLKSCSQDRLCTTYKTAVSKRTSTTKRRDRRNQPYNTSWLSGDEESEDDRSSSGSRPRQERHGSHQEKSSRIASSTPTAPHVPAVPSGEEKRRLSPPPVVLTLRRVAPSPHHNAKEAAGASKEYVVVQTNRPTNPKVCHDDTGSVKRPCSTLEDSDESRRQGSKRRISYAEYIKRSRSGDSRNVTASATTVETGTKVPDETEKSPISDRRVIKARRRMSQHELAEVSSQIRARKEALCPLITEKKTTDSTSRPTSSQPELAHSSATRCCGSADLSAAAPTQEKTPAVGTDGETAGVRHGRDVITHKPTSSRLSIGKSLIEFIKREEEKIRRDQKLRKLFRKKAAALAAKIGGDGARRSSGPPAAAELREKSVRSESSKRGDGRLRHSLGQSNMPPSDQKTDSRLPAQQYPLRPSNISQISQSGAEVQRLLAATAVAASPQNLPHGVRTDKPRDNKLSDVCRPADENAHRRWRAPRSSTQTPLRSMPIQAVYTAKEIEQGIRSIRNADAEIPSSHEQRLAAVPAPGVSNPALLTSLPTPRLSNPALLTSLPSPRLSNPALLTSLPTPRLSNPALLTSLPTPRLSNPALLTSLPTPRLSNPPLLTSLPKTWPSKPPPLSSLPTPQQVLQFMRKQRDSMFGEAAVRQQSSDARQQTSLPGPMTSPLMTLALQKNNQLQAGRSDRPEEPPIAGESATAWMPVQGHSSTGREATKKSNNNQAGRKDRPPRRKPHVAVKVRKTDNSATLGSATASMPMQGRSSNRTAMAVPLMVPTSDMNNNTITATATPALPAVLPDRIPLEDAIRLLVGTESKDDPSPRVDSSMAETVESPTSADSMKRAQSSSDNSTTTGKRGRSSGNSSSNLLPTSQSTTVGDKGPKKRARITTDTSTGALTKPQGSLTTMYNTCEPVDVSDASYNVKKDDGVDGYETPWNFGVTPNLSLSRSEGGLWHSCKPVKSLSRPPPLPPLYRPRPPGLEHVQDSPPPTSPGSPRHPSYPLRFGATGRSKPMNHYLTPYRRVGVLEHPGSPLQSTSTCPDHMVARYQNYLWIEPYDWADSGLCDMVDASVDTAVPNKQEEGQDARAMDI